jgi:hypothetical protein
MIFVNHVMFQINLQIYQYLMNRLLYNNHDHILLMMDQDEMVV